MTGSPFAVDVDDKEPQGALGQLRDQVTPAPVGSESTDPVSWSVPPACTVALVGVAATVIAMTVMNAVPDFVESAAEVAMRETFRSLVGELAGAV